MGNVGGTAYCGSLHRCAVCRDLFCDSADCECKSGNVDSQTCGQCLIEGYGSLRPMSATPEADQRMRAAQDNAAVFERLLRFMPPTAEVSDDDPLGPFREALEKGCVATPLDLVHVVVRVFMGQRRWNPNVQTRAYAACVQTAQYRNGVVWCCDSGKGYKLDQRTARTLPLFTTDAEVDALANSVARRFTWDVAALAVAADGWNELWECSVGGFTENGLELEESPPFPVTWETTYTAEGEGPFVDMDSLRWADYVRYRRSLRRPAKRLRGE